MMLCSLIHRFIHGYHHSGGCTASIIRIDYLDVYVLLSLVFILLMMRHGSLAMYPVIGSPVAFPERMFIVLTFLFI
jgi:hypothetical protein